MISQDARRRCFREFPETCPVVDGLATEAVDELHTSLVAAAEKALRTLISGIKSDVTEPFRDELLAAYERIEELEAEASDNEIKLRYREDQRDRLTEEVAELKAQRLRLWDELAEYAEAQTPEHVS